MRQDPEQPTQSECYQSLNECLRWHYLDWVNNYLTKEVFAQHNGISVEQADALIKIGRALHEEHCELMKRR